MSSYDDEINYFDSRISIDNKSMIGKTNDVVLMIRGESVNGQAVFPEEITEIRFCAFANDTDLISVNMPNRIDKMGGYVFINCENLETVKLSDNIRELCSNAFNCCRKLKVIRLPEHLGVMYSDSICGCDSLEELVIPDSVQIMYNASINYCKNLKKVTMPNIFKNASKVWPFKDCPNLKEIICGGELFTLAKFEEYLRTQFSSCVAPLPEEDIAKELDKARKYFE